MLNIKIDRAIINESSKNSDVQDRIQNYANIWLLSVRQIKSFIPSMHGPIVSNFIKIETRVPVDYSRAPSINHGTIRNSSSIIE